MCDLYSVAGPINCRKLQKRIYEHQHLLIPREEGEAEGLPVPPPPFPVDALLEEVFAAFKVGLLGLHNPSVKNKAEDPESMTFSQQDDNLQHPLCPASSP